VTPLEDGRFGSALEARTDTHTPPWDGTVRRRIAARPDDFLAGAAVGCQFRENDLE
jgi:hypothetical protein